MISNKTDTTVTSNMTGKEIAMRFDPQATRHLMAIMTDMYPDPEEAVLREYSNNALDSRNEAGSTRPIEVNTPTALDPKLSIRDYGVGLNEDDIEHVYSLYGASTKRETNQQTGKFGIGGKSALSYTSQFTVIGIKDGQRTVVDVARDEDGAGTMTIVDVRETEEGNGVEIQIPAQRYNSFEEKAKTFFQYWKPGEVLLNGKEPKLIEGLPVTDTIQLVKKVNYYERNVVVMGGVAYEIPNEVNPFTSSENYRLVAEVAIGEVEITPARDSLMLIKATRERMATLKEEIDEGLETAIQRDIDTASSAQEAMTKALNWRNVFNSNLPRSIYIDKLTWEDEEIPTSFEIRYTVKTPVTTTDDAGVTTTVEEDRERIERITTAYASSRQPGKHENYDKIQARTMVKGLVVYGYTPEKFSPAHKRKLEAYMVDKDFEVKHFILTDRPLNCRWIDSKRVARWETIKAIKIERKVAEAKAWKITGSYPAYLAGKGANSEEVLATDIDTTKPIFWFDTSTFEAYGSPKREQTERNERQAVALLREHDEDSTVIRLGLNRIVKFERDFPSAIKLTAKLEDLYNALVESLTDDEIKAWAFQHKGDHEVLAELDPVKVEDPDLCSAIQLATLNVDGIVKPLQALRQSDVNRYLSVEGIALNDVDTYDLEQYPLVSEIGSYRAKQCEDHIYSYVNAVYSGRKAAQA